jgi:hypothetical protein
MLGGSNLLAGTDNGVFLSTNNGASWSAANAGLTGTSVFALAMSGTNLFAGTYGRAVWHRPLSEMITDVESGRQLPSQFALQQNYPNPFNPSTTIRYSLPTTSTVQLEIFNTLGQQVALLQHGEQEAGYHEATFDGGGLSSGIYFYRLEAGEFVQTRRLLLLR